jgi:MULE transposase domain
MAYFSNLSTSSPPTSSQDDVFCTPLSRRASSITPGLSPGLSSLGSSLTRDRSIEHSPPPPERSESDNTGFSDDEVNDSDVSFTSQVSFQDSEGNLLQFANRDEVYKYLQAWAVSEGFAIKHDRTKRRPKTGQIYKQWFTCVCGGSKSQSYLKASAPSEAAREGRGKWVDCKWRCVGTEVDEIWTGSMLGNYHTHPRTTRGSYPIHRRQQRQKLPGIQQRILADKDVTTISVKETYIAVQQQFPGLDIDITDIFNIQAKAQSDHDDGLPAVQAMARDLGEAFHFHYSVDEHERLVNMAFFEKASLDLLRRWPYTVIIDATYKTNKFGLYLVDIVGMTGAGKTFIMGQAFLSAEGEEDYTYVLEWLRDLYVEARLEMPVSITTDKAGGLIVALKNVFPASHHLLCTVHINRDVLTYSKTTWRDELVTDVGGDLFSIESDNEQPVDPTTMDNGLISTEERQAYMDTREKRLLQLWWAVVNATTVPTFETAWDNLRCQFSVDHPKILSYLERIWMPFKESFCKACTNSFPHFGNTTSNRAEGSHRGVKRKLPTRRLHIRSVVDIMKTYLKYANKDHLKDVERDRTSIGRFFSQPVYHKLRYRITIFAMQKVEEHLTSFKEKDLSALPPCTGNFSRTWGVPCAHTVYSRLEAIERLEIDDFHPQWHLRKTTDFTPINPALLLRDPVIVRDRKGKGKATSTGRVLSAFEAVNMEVITATTRPTARTPKQRKVTQFFGIRSPSKLAITLPGLPPRMQSYSNREVIDHLRSCKIDCDYETASQFLGPDDLVKFGAITTGEYFKDSLEEEFINDATEDNAADPRWEQEIYQFFAPGVKPSQREDLWGEWIATQATGCQHEYWKTYHGATPLQWSKQEVEEERDPCRLPGRQRRLWELIPHNVDTEAVDRLIAQREEALLATLRELGRDERGFPQQDEQEAPQQDEPEAPPRRSSMKRRTQDNSDVRTTYRGTRSKRRRVVFDLTADDDDDDSYR